MAVANAPPTAANYHKKFPAHLVAIRLVKNFKFSFEQNPAHPVKVSE